MKTDRQLQLDVSAELNWEPSVHAAQIGVEVKDGVVTLAGEVGTYAEKWNAERATQRVSGVKALAIDLKVKPFGLGLGTRTDAEIALAVEQGLEWSTAVPTGAVKVMVENGWVTLSGDVDWQYQKQDVADNVRHLMGVTGVSNQIAIKAKVSEDGVKSDIEAALQRSAMADAKKILVEVCGADVTLTGTVSSWAERETARKSAWHSAGVQSVTDKMTLAW